METKLRSTLLHVEKFLCYTSFRELLFSCANSTEISRVIGLEVIKNVKNVRLLPCDWSVIQTLVRHRFWETVLFLSGFWEFFEEILILQTYISK